MSTNGQAPTGRNVTRVGALRALRAGQAAKAKGGSVTTCPYDVNGSLADRYLARFWLRGYAQAERKTS